MDIVKRDHIIFTVAMLFVAAGLADGLHRGFGVPWWGAVPFGLATWGTFAVLSYRHYQDAMVRAQEPEGADS
jgi:hypothetical protein